MAACVVLRWATWVKLLLSTSVLFRFKPVSNSSRADSSKIGRYRLSFFFSSFFKCKVTYVRVTPNVVIMSINRKMSFGR